MMHEYALDANQTVLHFDENEHTTVTFPNDRHRQPCQVRIADVSLLPICNLPVSARDLLRVALAVSTADKLVRRSPKRSRDERREQRWQRSVTLRVAVDNLDLLRSLKVDIEQVLRWMTDDHWSIEFRPRSMPPSHQATLYRPPRTIDEIALFSPGLDSAAGCALTATAGVRRLLISVHGESSLANAIEDSKVTLKRITSIEHPSASVQIQLHDGGEREVTQRTRGFLFFSIAAIMASIHDVETVTTFENGVGALNLAMSEAQVCAQNTRSMHPRTLILLQRIFSSALRCADDTQCNIILRAPFMFTNKSDMLRRLPPSSLHELATTSFSCDMGMSRRPARERWLHCGLCTSCLMRRASLHGIHGFSDPTAYSDGSERHGIFDRETFKFYALRMKALRSWSDVLQIDPDARFLENFTAPDSGLPTTRAAVEMLRRFGTGTLDMLDTLSQHPVTRRTVPHRNGAGLDLFPATR